MVAEVGGGGGGGGRVGGRKSTSVHTKYISTCIPSTPSPTSFEEVHTGIVVMYQGLKYNKITLD